MTMDGDDMKRGIREFWRKKQYKIAAACLLVAVLGITGVYLFASNRKTEEPKNQVAEIETEKPEDKITAKKDTKEEEETTEQTARASAVIKPKQKDSEDQSEKETEMETETAEIAQREEEKEEPAVETSTKAANTELHFDTAAGLLWPVSGSVILDYSMDQTVYFTTLDQYKYNPAVIISGNVNDKVQAAASGKITDISTNEVTGCTVTMDIGDGYTAVYGQLKEVPYEVGAYLEAGDTIGFVNEPTKYYSLEGSNLYFELKKDDVPIDPVEFFM